MLATLLKNILCSYFSKILTRGSEDLNFRITFGITLTFAEHHPTITSKAKYETTIRNSAKGFSSYEKMKKKNAFFLMKSTTCHQNPF